MALAAEAGKTQAGAALAHAKLKEELAFLESRARFGPDSSTGSKLVGAFTGGARMTTMEQ
jgi:hypothetical protein